MHLETKRLLIRSLQPADAPALAKIWTDPAVTRYMGGPRNYDKLLKDFQEDASGGASSPFDLWPVLELATDEIIGHCGLLDKEVDGQTEIELIYVLGSSAWGQGYATEAALAIRDYAFDSLKLKRLVSLIDPENQPSARVAQKVGMKLEKETVRPGGKLTQVYSIEIS